jgi:probable F420-dependent oxidoreductase
MTGGPSFGVVVPPCGEFGDPAAFADIVDTVEGLGYADVWFGDHVAVPRYAAAITDPSWTEPLTACFFALGRTRRLRAGTDVLVVPYRNPVLVAKMAATADALSGGRLVLGVGVGYLRGEFAALGADHDERGAITSDYMQAMRVLWDSAGEPVSYRGPHVAFEDVCMGPFRTTGSTPVWVGGNAPSALRRAATVGDGWHPLFPDPEGYRLGRERILGIRGGEAEFTFSISLATTRVLDTRQTFVPTSWAELSEIPDDFNYAPPVPATEGGRPRFVGNPDQIAADIDDYVSAGVQHFTLRFAADGRDSSVPDYLQQLQRFADDVKLRFPKAVLCGD